jgi:hypothetical protein
MSKGSKPRPIEIARKEFEENWERIFGNKDKSTDEWNKDILPILERSLDNGNQKNE